jgi:hypothetical protein
MNSRDGFRSTMLELPDNVVLSPHLVAGHDSYDLGFAAARKARVRDQGRGKSAILRVASIWVLQGRLAYEAELGASKPRYDGVTTLSVMGITVLGDGIGKAREVLTDANRPLHSLTLVMSRQRCLAAGELCFAGRPISVSILRNSSGQIIAHGSSRIAILYRKKK